MQLLLFPQHRLPERHRHWFRLANAGDYPHKFLIFSPFKARFLRQHALPDGYDLQNIEQCCNRCDHGTWMGRDFDLPKHLWQPCNRCDGTGIYRVKHIVLQRWQLGPDLYHLPTNLHHYNDDAATLINPSYRSTITGRIQHATVEPRDASRALLYLLALYDRPTLMHYARHRWHQLTQRAKRQLHRLNDWSDESFPDEPEFFDALNDIPF